jgi:coenzyme F420-0:L-glutamate ligase/coenzyme F420-1:gamma-L-glutamate ligase
MIAVLPLTGLPRVTPGMDVAALLGDAIDASRVGLKDGDVIVVCQKVVSKAEGAVVALDTVDPSPFARTVAKQAEEAHDPRLVEVVLRETARVVRNEGGHLIVETRHGWVCANAGVDQSNGLAPDVVTLLPADADASARRLLDVLAKRFARRLAVVVTDTFGRPWRQGQIDVAIGCAGMAPLLDLRGDTDLLGRPLQHTILALADQVAAAAGLVMVKGAGVPAAIVRGVAFPPGTDGAAVALVRPRAVDLFR